MQATRSSQFNQGLFPGYPMKMNILAVKQIPREQAKLKNHTVPPLMHGRKRCVMLLSQNILQ